MHQLKINAFVGGKYYNEEDMEKYDLSWLVIKGYAIYNNLVKNYPSSIYPNLNPRITFTDEEEEEFIEPGGDIYPIEELIEGEVVYQEYESSKYWVCKSREELKPLLEKTPSEKRDSHKWPLSLEEILAGHLTAKYYPPQPTPLKPPPREEEEEEDW